MKPHVYSDLIHAFADGATIEYLGQEGGWHETKGPSWSQGVEYRIKPEPDFTDDALIWRTEWEGRTYWKRVPAEDKEIEVEES